MRSRACILLNFFELFYIKSLIPSQINQHLDTPIKLKKGLRSGRIRQGALERTKGEHDDSGAMRL